ncbi:MAG: DUF433 domain-containing protein [Chloroflexi bacterium]|nr:DUF433 domain-containing protein [Chloroflexota bacterium]
MTQTEKELFRGLYTLPDAARLLRATTPATIESKGASIKPTARHLARWTRRDGMSKKKRVITFFDLIRLRMIALVRSRGISYRKIELAEKYISEVCDTEHPFLLEDMWTAELELFVSSKEKLIAASKYGQTAFDELLTQILIPVPDHGLSFGADKTPESWRPKKSVLIDPEIQFGSPCIEGTRIDTKTIWSLKQDGNSEASLAEMFDLEGDQVRCALEWETHLNSAA